MSFLSLAGSALTKVQKLRIPMPPWSTIERGLPHGGQISDDVLGMHEEHVGRIGRDHLLRLDDQRLALVRIRLAALVLGDLVVGLVGVADEIEALVRRGRVEQVEHELVRIAALGTAHHAPHRGVPLLAIVPDEIGQLRARKSPHLDIETKLAPFLRNELGGLVFLRVGGLRGREQHELANGIASRMAGRRHGQLRCHQCSSGNRKQGSAACRQHSPLLLERKAAAGTRRIAPRTPRKSVSHLLQRVNCFFAG